MKKILFRSLVMSRHSKVWLYNQKCCAYWYILRVRGIRTHSFRTWFLVVKWNLSHNSSVLIIFRFTLWLKLRSCSCWSLIRTFRHFWIGSSIGASPEMTKWPTDASSPWPPFLPRGNDSLNICVSNLWFLCSKPVWKIVHSISFF